MSPSSVTLKSVAKTKTVKKKVIKVIDTPGFFGADKLNKKNNIGLDSSCYSRKYYWMLPGPSWCCHCPQSGKVYKTWAGNCGRDLNSFLVKRPLSIQWSFSLMAMASKVKPLRSLSRRIACCWNWSTSAMVVVMLSIMGTGTLGYLGPEATEFMWKSFLVPST